MMTWEKKTSSKEERRETNKTNERPFLDAVPNRRQTLSRRRASLSRQQQTGPPSGDGDPTLLPLGRFESDQDGDARGRERVEVAMLARRDPGSPPPW